jgi:hypothetical protein
VAPAARSSETAVTCSDEVFGKRRAAVTTVSIDMCAAFRVAARQQLPNATICVDAFHLVQLANNMVNTVRRRIVRAKYGRRGRKDDPEYGIKRLLLRNLEDLRDEQVAKLWHTMADDPALTDLHLVWIAKENLRDLLALRITRAHTTPAPSVVRDRWSRLLSWCADHDHIPRTGKLRTHSRRLAPRDHQLGTHRRLERVGFTLHLLLMIRCLRRRLTVAGRLTLMLRGWRGLGGGLR